MYIMQYNYQLSFPDPFIPTPLRGMEKVCTRSLSCHCDNPLNALGVARPVGHANEVKVKLLIVEEFSML